ncbi:MAG: cytochrome c3 family protein [Omnitrophica WOR_2 bacterium]
MTVRRKARRGKKTRRHFSPVIPGIALIAFLVVSAGSLGVSMRMEDHDAFCASCHTQPESTYYQRTLTKQAVDLASSHRIAQNTRCIDCHSGGGLTGRMGAIFVGGGDLLRWVTHTARQPAPLVYPISDGNCLKCHADTPDTQDFSRHFHAFLLRWQAIDPNAARCADCHSSHTTDGDVSLGYLNQQRTVTICQNCHNVLRQ